MPITIMTVLNSTGRPLNCGQRIIVPGGMTMISFSEFQFHVFSDGVNNVVIKKQDGIVDCSTNGDFIYEEKRIIKRDDGNEERRYVEITVKGANAVTDTGKWA